MNRKNTNQLVRQLLAEIVGSIFIAAGVYNFAVQADFPMSGFTGLAIILYRFTGLPVGLSIIFINIPVAFVCFRLLGKKFFISSIRCMLISSLFIDYLAPLFPVYGGSRMLAALCTGVFNGLGFAVIYMNNTSTGGMDFIVMAIKKKKPYLSMGRIVFFADMGIVLLGGILLKDIDGIIYGMIVNFLLAAVMDKIMYGMNAGKMALIVTDYGQKVCDAIDETCHRGSTIINAVGGYRGEKREVVMCACSTKEMYRVRQAAKAADERAFVIIMESSEVHGEGFRNIQIG
ncbi:MAG: YitT family protein [Eubacteriales bacterium]|nr:YitT family protein [Eubacteriales bacterium]